jgi:hypothetical protein
MDKRMLVTMIGIAALAIYAAIGKSAAMFVSAAAIAVIVYLFRHARVRDRVIGVVAAGLGGSIGAEIVHTFYHYTNLTGSAAADTGNLFMSALVVGLINAALVAIVIFVTEAWLKMSGDKSR